MEVNLFRMLVKPMKMNVRKGDRVLILSDYKVERAIYDALVMAVFSQEAIPILMVIPPVEAFGHEPVEMVSKAVLECDLIIAVCSTAMSHTNAIRAGLKSGKRYFAMGGATIESLTQGAATADFEQLYALSKKIAEIMSQGKHVRVTSKEGTNVQFSIEGRKALPLTGVMEDEIGKAGFPDGEVAISPLEGTAHGVIVIDGSMHHIGKLDSEIRLVLERGKVVRIEGKNEAERLSQFLQKHGDENSYNLAEFAIGTNSAATIADNTQEAKKMLGTVHFALGDNMSIGGNTYSKIHMDGMVMKPSVVIDETRITEDGKMLITC